MATAEALTEKTTLVNADIFVILDSAATSGQDGARRVSFQTLNALWSRLPLGSATPTSVGSGAAAAGSAGNAAREDHKHNFTGSTAGATAFTGLSDTPANFTGAGGNVVAVNSGADALEFVGGVVSFIKA